MKLTPTEDQLDHAAWMASTNAACDFSEPGTGKTLTAILALTQVIGSDRTCVIVVPPIVLYQWYDMALQYFDRSIVKMIRTGRDWPAPQHRILIVSYHIAKVGKMWDTLLDYAPEIVIFDEAHAMKSATAQVTERMLGEDRSSGLIYAAERVWFLTGTPIRRYPDDLYPMLRRAFPGYLQAGNRFSMTYDQFVDRYCTWQMKRFGHMHRAQKIVTGAKNQSELRSLMNSISVRRTLESMKGEIPDVTYNTLNTDIDDKLVLDVLYEAIPDMARMAGEDAEDLIKEMVASGDAALATVRRLIAREKAKSVQLAQYISEQPHPVVVYAWHRDAMNELADSLHDGKVAQIHGGTRPSQREQILKAFAAGAVDILIGQIASMGTGLDGLQKVCHHAIFLEQDYSPAVNEQAIARLNRLGQNYPVHVDIVVADNWVDHATYDIVNRKTAIIEELIK